MASQAGVDYQNVALLHGFLDGVPFSGRARAGLKVGLEDAAGQSHLRAGDAVPAFCVTRVVLRVVCHFSRCVSANRLCAFRLLHRVLVLRCAFAHVVVDARAHIRKHARV